MAAGQNKVFLIGNLGADPDLRATQAGTPVASLSIATSRKWKDRSTGDTKEETEWHRVSVWGKQAERCSEYLAKGRQVSIEGRLRTRKWEDKDDITRYTTEVVAERVLFLGGSPAGSRPHPSTEDEPSAPDWGDYDIPF